MSPLGPHAAHTKLFRIYARHRIATDLLADRTNTMESDVREEWYLEKGRILVEKLADFGVEGEIVNVCPGPVITVYEFKDVSEKLPAAKVAPAPSGL